MQNPFTRKLGAMEQFKIPLNYLTKSDHLDILGIKLYANFNFLRVENRKQIKRRVEQKINLWWSEKFMPLTNRAFSVNTYILSKETRRHQYN